MKTISKVVLALAFASSISACGALEGITGPITIEPGCLIFCGAPDSE